MSNNEKKPNLSVVGNAHVIDGNDIAWNTTASGQVDVELYDTLPKILAYNAAHYPNEVAQREKEFAQQRTEQEQMLRDADKRRAEQLTLSETLETEFEENEFA